MAERQTVLTFMEWDLQAALGPAGWSGRMGDDFELMPGEVINLKLERVGVFYGSTCGLEPQACPSSLWARPLAESAAASVANPLARVDQAGSRACGVACATW